MSVPKRPWTAFMRYSNERRPQIRENDRTMSMVDISKQIGQEWRTMSDSKKRPFHDAAQKAQQNYKRQKVEYEKSKPKRPRTAYALFMKHNRASIALKHPEVSPRDLMKYIAKEWKALKDKSKYKEMAKSDKERWQRESI